MNIFIGRVNNWGKDIINLDVARGLGVGERYI